MHDLESACPRWTRTASKSWIRRSIGPCTSGVTGGTCLAHPCTHPSKRRGVCAGKVGRRRGAAFPTRASTRQRRRACPRFGCSTSCRSAATVRSSSGSSPVCRRRPMPWLHESGCTSAYRRSLGVRHGRPLVFRRRVSGPGLSVSRTPSYPFEWPRHDGSQPRRPCASECERSPQSSRRGRSRTTH